MECVLPGVCARAALLLLLVIQLSTGVTQALHVTSEGPQTFQKAVGEKVTLGCTYTTAPEDTGELDIEWLNVSPDMTQKDKLLMSFAGGKTIYYGDPSVSKRLDFVADPMSGDASITLSDVRVSDTATYQCKVKKMPGVDMRKLTLVVLTPPSRPKCWVDGGEEKGGPVSLRCQSSQGSTPLTYTWIRESGGAIPPNAIQNSQTGELLIRNHSDSYVGNYACEAKNPVGSGRCRYTLHAYNPTNKAGVIAGAVIGALLLLLLLLLLIWLIIICCNKRRYEDEVHNELREDVQTPPSRSTSRQSSARSMPGYNTHHSLKYVPVNNVMPSVGESQIGPVYNGTTQPAAPAHRPAHLKYDHQYGYPV